MAIPVIGAIIKAAAGIKNIPVEIRQNHTDPIRAQRRELRKLLAPVGNSSLPVGRADVLVATDKAVADALDVAYAC